MYKYILLTLLFIISACSGLKTTVTTVGKGWSGNSVNTVIFRNSALTSFKNYQFTAYYDGEGKVVLGKRKHGQQKWETIVTPYKGKVKDAHNSISIAVDSKGYLHMAWDHHDNPLRYARSTKPLGLELTEKLPMTGEQEEKVTYPEFHNLPDGKLLFCYRSGQSGRGNMVINSYDPDTQKWKQVQQNLIDGEGKRSAYWQMAIGKKGIYMSWVWRESWDVRTNHDLQYAFSSDGGKTWEKSNGEKYQLPITQQNAEVIWQVPQNSNLINQTSITVDENDNPYIASYWKNTASTQYKVVCCKDNKWQLLDTNFQNNAFDLGGGGTKRIPISRPEILVNNNMVYLLFREEERASKISLAYTNLSKIDWKIADISNKSVGQWEPNLDKEIWKSKNELQVFSQEVNQTDGEGISKTEPTDVEIITVKKLPK